MRFVVAVEGYRNSPPFFLEVSEEMVDADPQFPLIMGQLVGLYMKHGGELSK